MSYSKIPPGRELPADVNVIIEIPANHDPIKYEIDKSSDSLFVDRFVATPMFYPANYGYIPATLSEDGDPVDVLVVSPHPVVPGSVIRSRPIGMLKMTDEAGPDSKLIAVPHRELTPMYDHILDIRDLPEILLKQTEHYFENYKDLEEHKWVKVDGWTGVEEAHNEIMASRERYLEVAADTWDV